MACPLSGHGAAAILGGMVFVPPARHLLRAKDLADARYAEPLDVDDLAARRRAVARALQPRVPARVRRVAARVPADAPARARRGAAAHTDRSVAEICFSVGLQSVGSFTTSFTRTYGMSPTAYRAAFPPAAGVARVPGCVLRVYGRPQRSTFREDRRAGRSRLRFGRMIKIANAQLWVHDQDEALAFYTQKLGLEVRSDVTLPELGDFRWLTVGPARPGRHRDRADGDPRRRRSWTTRRPSRSAP